MKFIITGPSSGLGFCLTERLILQGQVAGVSRSIGRSSIFCQSGFFNHIQHDFSEKPSTDQFNCLVEKLKIFIDSDPFALILNAASFYSGKDRLSDSSLTSLFEVNVFSIISLVRALEGSNLKRIFIVNSISGLIGQNQQHEYTASKHAVMGFARSLAKSAKNANYDVMCINPGGMQTALWSNHKEIDTSDFLRPEMVADICISLISIPQRTFIEHMSILPPSDVY
jgi:NAD(P)-dependent dehydrogenase (short-subunit alcohol dehydrogenase family)